MFIECTMKMTGAAVLSAIYCLCVVVATAQGKAHSNFSSVTSSQVVLINSTTVQFTCVAMTPPDIRSVVWLDPNGVEMNSTLVVHNSSDFDSTVTSILEVDRVNCAVTEEYVCLFDNGMVSFSDQLGCPPVLDVIFESSINTVDEADGCVPVCVLISNAPNGSKISFLETDITATRREDFSLLQTFEITVEREQLTPDTTNRSAASTIVSGRLCFNVTIIQDIVFEDELESFGLEVRASDVLATTRSETTIYIRDDDELVVGLERDMYKLNEGDSECSQAVRVCALINGGITGLPLTITPLWKQGSAIDGLDYNPPPCNFTFRPGGFIDCMDLILIDDNIIENTENLTVEIESVFVDETLVQPGNASRVRIDVRQSLIEIADNDAIELSFEETTYTIHEGGSGEDHLAVKVCLVQSEQGAHTIDLGGMNSLSVDIAISTRDGTAIGGRDFVVANFTRNLLLPLPTFGTPTDICECIEIINDDVAESTEFFDLRLHSSHPLVKTNNSRVLIMDSQTSVTVGFERSEYTVSESEGLLEVCVILNGSYEKSIHIYLCSEPGTAIEDIDYVGIRAHRLLYPSNTFSPPVSGGRQCVNVTVLEDGLVEQNETFQLILQSPDSAVRFETMSSTVTVLSEDGVPPSLEFIHNTPFVEGNSATADFIITNKQLVLSIICVLMGPGRTPPASKNCSSGHVTFSGLPLRRQQFTLTVTAFLQSQPLEPLVLTEVALRLDHDVCWLHPINRGVVTNGSDVIVEWQSTGPRSDNKVSTFFCKRDRERVEAMCTSPFIWVQPSPGHHSLSVRPAPTTGCRRHLTRVFNFSS